MWIVTGTLSLNVKWLLVTHSMEDTLQAESRSPRQRVGHGALFLPRSSVRESGCCSHMPGYHVILDSSISKPFH